ncbi:hypothetical protein [Azospirillum doebereinerae]
MLASSSSDWAGKIVAAMKATKKSPEYAAMSGIDNPSRPAVCDAVFRAPAQH